MRIVARPFWRDVANRIHEFVRQVRSTEYATLKALGLDRRRLFGLVGAQAAGLAIAGTALGIVVALAVARAVSVLAPKYLIAVGAEAAAGTVTG